MKLLVQEKKGSSFRLLDIDENKVYRALISDFKNLCVGSLLDVEAETISNIIVSMTIKTEKIGDSSKKRVEVCIDEKKVGDLIDDVPILKIGQVFAKNGKKMAYAYFN